MGQVVRTQLGQGTAQRTVSAGLLTAAGYDPEPISASIMAGVGVLLKFFKFGYDPKKLNDTALTEGLIVAFNKAWEQITGEQLPSACDPGQCGKQHQAIFTRTQWPNVPFPAGRPGLDLAQYVAAFQGAIAEGRSKLQRSESVADYDANANYVLSSLQKVAQRAAAEASAGSVTSIVTGLLPRTEAGGIDFGKLLPWVAGGVLAYKFL